MASEGQQYKVKLTSGRILGPLDLGRVRKLILKNQIIGKESAREHPNGEWCDINSIPAIGELLLQKAAGTLKSLEAAEKYQPIRGPVSALDSTILLPGAEGKNLQIGELKELNVEPPSVEDDATMVGALGDDDKTRIADPEDIPEMPSPFNQTDAKEQEVQLDRDSGAGGENRISQEKTVVFQRSPGGKDGKKSSKNKLTALKTALAFIMIGLVAYELFLSPPSAKTPYKFVPIRPSLPAYIQGRGDPQLSQKLYLEAMRFYVADNVTGYKKAAEKLLQAASNDVTNVKALAMLASCYLNLIDSSNKDENYFSVISKLIEMSRAKALDLPETIIADVEFYMTINKAEAAQNRIVEYTKTHQQFGLEMFYYLAYAFYGRGDAQSAAKYVSNYPDNKAFSAKLFYLRGQIAEKLNDNEAAMREYERAVQFNKDHAKSRVRIADLLARNGGLKKAAEHLDYVVRRPALLGPQEMAKVYFLHAQLNELYEKWDNALADVERAVALDKNNHDYLLEFYTLRTKVGESVKAVQKEARMYYFLSSGEKQLKFGNYHEALSFFLQAREANLESYIPPAKIGDMFLNLGDISNARMNYKLAAERAPNNIDVWSKYINSLIQSYEWEEAQKAMTRFRNMAVSQSAIDKAAGDMYARQGRHVEAQMYYKKAMGRDSIDSSVYIAYAKSLMATKNYKDAPFFFALAMRFDPFNSEAIIGTAKCIAASESIDRAISMLQDELQKESGNKAEMLAAIAEFQIQKGEWAVAQQYIDQAMSANADYAYPWKLQAQVYMNKEGLERDALDKALAAYKSYSDRNASDPSGYLERYRIFIKKTEFEKASDELSQIYAIYPKYPNLHYYKGALYSIMGNHRVAVEEFKIELANNPTAAVTMIALGKELIELGAVQDALNFFNKAMQTSPRMAEARHQSAWANFLLKNHQAAVALYRSALALDPANPTIYKRMGLAYREMGDGMNARSSFKKYLEMEPDAPDKSEFERYL